MTAMTEKPKKRVAKRKAPTLESLEDAQKARETVSRPVIPWKENPQVYASREIHIRTLTRKQARALRMVFDALHGHRSLEDNHVVTFRADAVRWILEQIADGMPWTANDDR